MALLIRAGGCTAAVQFEIELVSPDRQSARQGLQSLEITAQGSVLLGAGHGLLLPEGQLLQHLGGWATAVVTNPREP